MNYVRYNSKVYSVILCPYKEPYRPAPEPERRAQPEQCEVGRLAGDHLEEGPGGWRRSRGQGGSRGPGDSPSVVQGGTRQGVERRVGGDDPGGLGEDDPNGDVGLCLL